ncbi:hypothetical protein KAW08_00500 [bacterium]|nr:hypothetical protein [bacterium]
MQKFISLKQAQDKLTFSGDNGGLISIEKGVQSFKFSNNMLWQIILRNEKREQVIVSNQDKGILKYRLTSSKIILSWDMSGSFRGLKVNVTIKLKDGLSYWGIEVTNNTMYSIWEVDFPYIGGIGKIAKNSGKDYLAIPWQWGVSVADPIKFISEEELKYSFGNGVERKAHQLAYEYPGMYSMQFLAYGNPDLKGLYIGAHDGDANYKRFGFYGKKNCTEVDYILKNYPEEMKSPGKDYKMPYEVVIGIFDGNWSQASQIYKNWALKQEWCTKGKISARKDIPDWVKETGLWYWNYKYYQRKGEPDDTIPALIDLKKRMKVPMAFHWYGWDDKHNDLEYPEYTLTKKRQKRLDSAIKRFKEEGIRVIPYMNGRLWNVDTKSWYEEDAGRYACLKEGLDETDIKYYIEPYANRPFVAMCPFTKFWQDKVIANTKKVLGYGVDGIYIDQVSSAYAALCFASNHGHSIGGNYWYKGYKTMMERLQKEARKKYPQSAFTSESVIECFIGVFDAFLGYQCASFGSFFNNMFGKDSLTIPLFSSVYHGYIPLYATGATIKKEKEFYLGTAWDACGGIQPSIDGYFTEDIGKKEYEQRLKYMEEWVRKYYRIRDKLIDAEWLPVNDVKTKIEKIELADGVIKKVPAVVTSLWKCKDWEMIFLAVNHTDKRQKMALSFKPNRYGVNGECDLVEVGIENETVLLKSKKEIKFDMSLKPKSVNLYQIIFSEKGGY